MQSRTPTANLSEPVQAVRTSLRRSGSILLLLALFLVMAPAALAHNIWYVDGVNGSDGNDCKSSVTACKTIGHAISLASSGDSIMVAPATYSENLTINLSLRITGSGAATTIVDGGGVATVFTIPGTATHVLLSELTIRNGYTQNNGGGIENLGTLTVTQSTISGNSDNSTGSSYGGGIYNWGTLTVKDSTISGNSAELGGGIFQGYGPLTVNQSTITGNSATQGGGIEQGGGTLTINNSTISGNSGTYEGGGLALVGNNGGWAAINNSTISGNSATYGGGIDNAFGLTINNSTISGNSGTYGGGISNFDNGAATLQNSIVANSTSGGNCWFLSPITDNGYNLSSDDTCNFSGPGDMNNTNPRLLPLGNYGGPTQTMALPGNSPAIDAGNPDGCTDSNGNLLKTDQRGAPRPGPYDDHGCDMGAFENQRH